VNTRKHKQTSFLYFIIPFAVILALCVSVFFLLLRIEALEDRQARHAGELSLVDQSVHLQKESYNLAIANISAQIEEYQNLTKALGMYREVCVSYDARDNTTCTSVTIVRPLR
jgi:hypothetical protein